VTDKVEQAVQFMLANNGLIEVVVWSDLSLEERKLASAAYRARISPGQRIGKADSDVRVAEILARQAGNPVTASSTDSTVLSRRERQREKQKEARRRRAYRKSRPYLVNELDQARYDLAHYSEPSRSGGFGWQHAHLKVVEQTRYIADLAAQLAAYDAAHNPICPACGEQFHGGRADQRYCSGRCRVRAFRVTTKATTAESMDHGVVT
jgi:hypothetical protein